eukprot:snap_masked-scaffold_27-processed-gene-3.7-mRNA-1 protein AED:1.00 eAED:1.00 QI:0/-1/0/0/-1/1/1/0/79
MRQRQGYSQVNNFRPGENVLDDSPGEGYVYEEKDDRDAAQRVIGNIILFLVLCLIVAFIVLFGTFIVHQSHRYISKWFN